MKKIILIVFLSLFPFIVQSQTIKKESLVRIQTITEVTPKPGYTLTEFEEFYKNEVVKAYEENLPDVKFYMTKAVRGENQGRFGVLWFADSQDVYFKYHHSDGSYTEIGRTAREGIEPILNKLNEIAAYKTVITDWVIQ